MNTFFVHLLARHGITLPAPRGMVRCIFHQDNTPSLSIDTEKGVFHCFGCGVAGGIKGFAALVGDTPLSSKHERIRFAVQARRREAEQRAQAISKKRRDTKAAPLWAAWGEANTTALDAADLLGLFFRHPSLADDFPAVVASTEADYSHALWTKMLVEQCIAGEVSL